MERSETRWQLVVISDEDPDIIRNVLRRTVLDLAETFGEDDRVAFSIAVTDPDGCFIASSVRDDDASYQCDACHRIGTVDDMIEGDNTPCPDEECDGTVHRLP